MYQVLVTHSFFVTEYYSIMWRDRIFFFLIHRMIIFAVFFSRLLAIVNTATDIHMCVFAWTCVF